MKNYDPNITYGVHTVEITLQQWGYVGHLKRKRGGNCKGINVLNFDFGYEDESGIDSDCDFCYDEDEDLFFAILKDENGNTLEVEGEAEEFNDMIVKLEILELEKYK